jgi:hypothetical protein
MFVSSIGEDDDKLRSQFVGVHGCFSLIVEDNNKPFGSLLSFAFFSLVRENDAKSGGSSCSLGFIPQLQTTMMSQDLDLSLSLVVFL